MRFKTSSSARNPMKRHRISTTAAFACFLSIGSLHAAPAARGPQPGDVYREFAAHQGGDNWRVTNPEAEGERPRKHLPNPVMKFSINSLEGALRAEVMLDRWSGHVQT